MSLAGRVVLVTGADGFIGSHVVDRLLDDGATVRAMCWYNSRGSWGWLDDLPADRRSAVDVRLGDVRDAGFVDTTVAGAEVVLHLAALVSVPHSYESPESFLATNVTGTFNVLEAARRYSVGRVVHTSTSEVYGTPESLPITESHPLKGQSPYSATKIAADKLAEAWSCSYGLDVVLLRPFNTYGPRQSARAVIPTILSQLLAGCEQIRLGSLHPRRDFTFVTDTADAFARAAAVADLGPGEVIHLGTGVDYSVADLVERTSKLLGVTTPVMVEEARVRPASSEVQVLRSDPSRAHQRLGWSARVGLDDGLLSTAEWLRARVDRNHDQDFVRRYHR